jgi:hypothetical protein
VGRALLAGWLLLLSLSACATTPRERSFYEAGISDPASRTGWSAPRFVIALEDGVPIYHRQRGLREKT